MMLLLLGYQIALCTCHVICICICAFALSVVVAVLCCAVLWGTIFVSICLLLCSTVLCCNSAMQCCAVLLFSSATVHLTPCLIQEASRGLGQQLRSSFALPSSSSPPKLYQRSPHLVQIYGNESEEEEEDEADEPVR